jgi:translocation and assembly module TamB
VRALRRALAWLGWTALTLAAAVGLALSAIAFLAAAPMTRPLVASRVVALLDEGIAGSLVLEGVEVLARGGMELRGLEVYDPHGHLVLSAGRARVFTDITGLRRRVVGLSVEIESPSVLLEEEPGGGVSIARAFAPARPAPAVATGEARDGGSRWTVHVARLTVRRGDLWWVDARAATRLEASEIDLDARGLVGPGRTRADLRLRGSLTVPAAGKLAVDLVGGITGSAVRIPVLRAELGGTVLSAVAEGDLARLTGRAAVTRLGFARETARSLAPRAPGGDDLAATAYAESDGEVMTAAVRAEPAGKDTRGRADAALAARLPDATSAVGFDVVLDRLDPSRIVADAPAGEVTAAARGAASGRSLRELRGRLAATVQRSRLRRGEIGRAEIVARAERGTIEVSRAVASAPGVDVEGTLRWREGGEAAGRIVVRASDLGVALENLGALLGEGLAPLGGHARLEATLAGTSAAPAASVAVDAPLLRIGTLTLAGARISADLAGPPSVMSGSVEGRVESLRGERREVARELVLRGSLADEAGAVTATASLPGFRDPASLEARGRLGPGRETLVLSELTFAYPGSRWALAAPSTVTFAGPAVDRLELAEGGQRLVLSGGLVRGRTLEARAEVVRLDLARLPAGLLPPEDAIRGELTANLSAGGRVSRPEMAGTFSLAAGAFRNLAGLSLAGSARWSGPDRRATASAAVSREGGGTLDLEIDVPLPFAGRPAERVLVRARAREVPLEEVLLAAGGETPAAGLVGLDAVLEGTAGAPSLSLGATLAEGEWKDLAGVGLELAVEDPGERLRVSARLALEGLRAVALDGEVPLDLSDVLDRPAAAFRAMRTAPLEGSLAVTGLDLGHLSGHAGIPSRMAGAVDGAGSFSGSLAAPRARVALDLARAAWAGFRDLSGRIEIGLGDATVSAQGRLAMAGDEAVRFEASLRAPVERLLSLEALGKAPLRAEVKVPRLSLARAASPDRPLSGTVDARFTAGGTLRAPEATLSCAGEGVAVEGRPLGDARLEARYARASASGDIVLRPAAGGSLRATFAVSHDLGLGAEGRPLGDAPAELSAVAEDLDLGFLPAAAPATVRSAAGKLSLDVRAKGPLARPSPRGTLRVSDGRLAVAEYGEWTGIAVEAEVTEDAAELARLEVHRGSGRLTAVGSLRGLRAAERAVLEAHLSSEGFTVARAGQDLATLDLRADATGSWDGSRLAVDVRVPRGVVRLPKRAPRSLQTLEARKDIVVGKRAERRRRAIATREAAAAVAPERPFTVAVRLGVERNLFVKSDDPRVDVELKADVEYERVESEDYARGFVEVVRGYVEPISGRSFVIERGRVQFTGGPPSAAMLDVEARYDNPAAVVTVNVQGPAAKPEIQLRSVPPMDDGQIAMLIATGRTELKAGSGGVGTLTGEEAGRAALGALATQAFRNLVADKLPLDTVALESGALRAGKYVTDKIYVGYTRRFDADPQRGENADEVRVEYQISPHWIFESRYGNAQSGGASLIWSREY